MPAVNEKPAEFGDIPWLSPDDYNKALFRFRTGVEASLRPLNTMGQEPFIRQSVYHICKLAEDFSLVTRGVSEHRIDTEETVRYRNGLRG